MVDFAMLPSKLAFVDIETTGLGVTRDRIIEIGILRVENSKLVKTFHSLVNPQGYVSPFSLGLTGITEDALEKAPTFYEIQDEVYELLQDCVFVAHNVRFDYGFIRNEFKRHNKTFSAKHFCTVRLSQALFPTERKHNLDAVINRFNLPCEKRHRAFDDAKVLWDFYQVLQKTIDKEALEKALKGTLKKPSLPVSIPASAIDALPEKPGVYIFYGENNTPLYVGKSVNIRERVLSHFANDYGSSKEMNIAQQIKSIEAIPTSGELGALIKESQLIKKMQPLYNRQLRLTKKLYVLKKKINTEGYPEVFIEIVTIIDPNELQNILGIFRSKKQAKDSLLPLVKEYQLCEKLLGLEKTAGACFAYRLNQCKGACLKEEKSLNYMIRFQEAFRNAIKPWPFTGPVIIREENHLEETGEYFVVDKWCLLGQYVTEDILTRETAQNDYAFDLDTYKLLVRFLQKRRNWKYITSFPKKMNALQPASVFEMLPH